MKTVSVIILILWTKELSLDKNLTKKNINLYLGKNILVEVQDWSDKKVKKLCGL